MPFIHAFVEKLSSLNLSDAAWCDACACLSVMVVENGRLLLGEMIGARYELLLLLGEVFSGEVGWFWFSSAWASWPFLSTRYLVWQLRYGFRFVKTSAQTTCSMYYHLLWNPASRTVTLIRIYCLFFTMCWCISSVIIDYDVLVDDLMILSMILNVLLLRY